MPKRKHLAISSARAALGWLNSYPKVSKWCDATLVPRCLRGSPMPDSDARIRMSKFDLPALLEAHKGLALIPNFLPSHVADGVLELLESFPGEAWNMTEASEDYSENNISHVFLSTKGGPGLDAITRALTLVLPESLNAFSAAKYCNSHHIAPHDDRAYTKVLMENGQVVQCSRDIALIYYLTKDWKREYGGLLVDLEASTTYVPLFNSAVIFRVPRYHQVTAMTVDRPRYSIFGWFLEPGIKYDLYQGEPADQQQQETGTKSKKRRKQLQEGNVQRTDLPEEAAEAQASRSDEELSQVQDRSQQLKKRNKKQPVLAATGKLGAKRMAGAKKPKNGRGQNKSNS